MSASPLALTKYHVILPASRDSVVTAHSTSDRNGSILTSGRAYSAFPLFLFFCIRCLVFKFLSNLIQEVTSMVRTHFVNSVSEAEVTCSGNPFHTDTTRSQLKKSLATSSIYDFF